MDATYLLVQKEHIDVGTAVELAVELNADPGTERGRFPVELGRLDEFLDALMSSLELGSRHFNVELHLDDHERDRFALVGSDSAQLQLAIHSRMVLAAYADEKLETVLKGEPAVLKRVFSTGAVCTQSGNVGQVAGLAAKFKAAFGEVPLQEDDDRRPGALFLYPPAHRWSDLFPPGATPAIGEWVPELSDGIWRHRSGRSIRTRCVSTTVEAEIAVLDFLKERGEALDIAGGDGQTSPFEPLVEAGVRKLRGCQDAVTSVFWRGVRSIAHGTASLQSKA